MSGRGFHFHCISHFKHSGCLKWVHLALAALTKSRHSYGEFSPFYYSKYSKASLLAVFLVLLGDGPLNKLVSALTCDWLASYQLIACRPRGILIKGQ